MQPYGIIIGGGAGTRLGGVEKPLVDLAGVSLVTRVIDRVGPQVVSLGLNVRQASLPLYASLPENNIDLLTDEYGGDVGPLGGVIAGLDWAAASGGATWLATFPADTPFLPRDLVSRLQAVAQKDKPVAAVAEGRLQPLCALWPLSCRDALRDGIVKGDYRGVGWTLSAFGAIECAFETSRDFFNINTMEDLAEAKRILDAQKESS